MTVQMPGVSFQAPVDHGEPDEIALGDQRHLKVNADTRAGSLAVEILDEKQDPIPGFGRGDCEVVREDTLSREIRWRGERDLASLRGRAVRIRIYLRSGDLYSVQLN